MLELIWSPPPRSRIGLRRGSFIGRVLTTLAKCSIIKKGSDVSNNGAHLANVNPFRYRGYYYDAEIGMYDLQSIIARVLLPDAPDDVVQFLRERDL